MKKVLRRIAIALAVAATAAGVATAPAPAHAAPESANTTTEMHTASFRDTGWGF